MRLEEIRQRCQSVCENYAICYAYGTDIQKQMAALELAELSTEVLPVLISKIDRLTKERDEAVIRFERMRDDHNDYISRT